MTTMTGSDVAFTVDDSPEDPDWDRFLEGVPTGHHVQTSMWSRVKATVGWTALRIIARRDDEIVGGAQLLIRPIRALGHVGYVAHGPVAVPGAEDVAEQVLDEVERFARERRIRHLTIQPPHGSTVPTDPGARRYIASTSQVAPGATIIVDLDVDADELLARMRRKTRYNVRTGTRKGITVRTGSESDIDTYHQMVIATGERQGFTPFPLEYFQEMWRALHPGGHLRLSIAELEGEPIAAQIAVPFGSTVINKLSVWSGREGKRRPNEAIQWATTRWALEEGYAHYDLEGIDVKAARLLLAGEELPDSFDQTVTSYKLGFGGRVVLAPPAHEFVYNPAARWAFGEVYPRLRGNKTVKRFVKRLRTGDA